MTTSGWLCIDFTRTRGWEARDRADDDLVDFDALVRWMAGRGALDEELASGLRRAADARPAEASRAHAMALELRGHVYGVLRAAGEGREPTADNLAGLNAVVARAAAHRRLERGSDGFRWTWAEGAEPLSRVVWPVALSAAELLTGDEVSRLRSCDADDCGWIFVDESRNRSRRWCDMSDCGNRAKVRRYRRRRRAEEEG